MFEESAFTPPRHSFKFILLLAMVTSVLMVGLTGSTPLTAKADAACGGGAWCPWASNHMIGSEWGNYQCQVAFGVSFPQSFSAKNNCGNNVRMAWKEGPIINWKFCMSPGGERPTPGQINYAGPC